MADAYGPQQLLAANLLPPALRAGGTPATCDRWSDNSLRAARSCTSSFDIAAPCGRWAVVGVGHRTQGAFGLGYALQNRLIVSRLFPRRSGR